MITEQTERLSKMVSTLLDMSELQTIARDEEIAISALVEEVLADLEPLAQEKGINLIEKCDNVLLMGSDILIYRLVYNLVENAAVRLVELVHIVISLKESLALTARFKLHRYHTSCAAHHKLTILCYQATYTSLYVAAVGKWVFQTMGIQIVEE